MCTKTPVKYILESVVLVKGTRAVLGDDVYGVYYRIADGKPVK